MISAGTTAGPDRLQNPVGVIAAVPGTVAFNATRLYNKE
jgi:hypothetical protein